MMLATSLGTLSISVINSRTQFFLPDRPETVESLFIAYRLTGDNKYREYGWRIFLSIEKFCRVETGGYASILNVENPKSRMEDRMETFLMVRVSVMKCSFGSNDPWTE